MVATSSANGPWNSPKSQRVAIAAEITVEQLARISLSFPTYTNVLGRAVFDAARQLGVPGFWDVPDATAASM